MAHGVIIRETPSQDAVNYRFAKHTAALDNGQVVMLSALADGEHDIWKVESPTTTDVWVVTGVELMYDEKKQITEYENEAGKPFRCERAKDTVIAISKEALTFASNEATDMIVGSSVVVGTGLNLILSATKVGNTIGTVIDVFTRGGIKFAAIRF